MADLEWFVEESTRRFKDVYNLGERGFLVVVPAFSSPPLMLHSESEALGSVLVAVSLPSTTCFGASSLSGESWEESALPLQPQPGDHAVERMQALTTPNTGGPTVTASLPIAAVLPVQEYLSCRHSRF